MGDSVGEVCDGRNELDLLPEPVFVRNGHDEENLGQKRCY